MINNSTRCLLKLNYSLLNSIDIEIINLKIFRFNEISYF
jgi:hypothetical protein